MPTPARARGLLLATILALAPARAAEPLDPASYARLVLAEHPTLASSRAALSAALAREQTAADWPGPGPAPAGRAARRSGGQPAERLRGQPGPGGRGQRAL